MRVTTNTISQQSYAPKIAMDPRCNAIAVWHRHDGTAERLYANRYVAGTKWGTETAIGTDDDRTEESQIGIDANGHATVVWQRTLAGIGSIQARRFD